VTDRATIGRDAYLCTGKEFARVRDEGQKLVGRYLVLGYLPAPEGPSRLGFIVSRQYDRHAVERNRARRLLRESYRLLRHRITRNLWLVAIARNALHGRRQPEVQAELARLLGKLDALAPLPGPTS
jgi:ribonuclease P protein component